MQAGDRMISVTVQALRLGGNALTVDENIKSRSVLEQVPGAVAVARIALSVNIAPYYAPGYNSQLSGSVTKP